MSKSEDINTLFRRFGGNADTYQEIVAADHAQAAEQHWPMLGQIRPLSHAEAPSARRNVPAGERMAQVEVVIYKSVPQVVYVPAEPVPPPQVPVAAEVAEVHSSVPASEPEPAGLTVVDMPIEPPPPLVQPVEAAKEVVPSLAATASHTDLKSMFDRMLPAASRPEPSVAASPLKRLIKW
jgi:resuscitation-promoting factor RpfA